MDNYMAWKSFLHLALPTQQGDESISQVSFIG